MPCFPKLLQVVIGRQKCRRRVLGTLLKTHEHSQGIGHKSKYKYLEATVLQELDLRGTAVAGNLKSLEKATKLKGLNLVGTAVAGNLKSLEKATELQKLDLGGTAVAGDLSVLLRFEEIEVVDLGRTQVHGSLSEAWRGSCPKLRSLTLSDAWQGWFQQSRVQRLYLFAYDGWFRICKACLF